MSASPSSYDDALAEAVGRAFREKFRDLASQFPASAGSPAAPSCGAPAPPATIVEIAPLPQPRPVPKAIRAPASQRWITWALLALVVVLGAVVVAQVMRPRKIFGAGKRGAAGAAPPIVAGAVAEKAAAPRATVADITDPSRLPPSDARAFCLFHADFCGHCKELKPFYMRAAAKYPDVRFLSCEDAVLKQAKSFASSLGLQGYPYVGFFKNGKLADSFVGNQGEKALLAFVAKCLEA